MVRIPGVRPAAWSPSALPGEARPRLAPLPAERATSSMAAQAERAERFGHRFAPAQAAAEPAVPAALPGGPAPAAGVIQAVIVKSNRLRSTKYKKANYRRSSKFRFIRLARRSRAGFATKGKAGINFFTVKYKKDGKAYYLTTRSVPTTNAASFKLPPGHSEERFKALRARFQKEHKLKDEHLEWGATEREPCGEGAGMANCRHTLSTMGIPKDKVYFGHEYADREDMRSNANETSSALNEKASEERGHHNTAMEEDVRWLGSGHDSETESEDDKDVVDEYESDYDEKPTPRRKQKVKKLADAFRGGFDS